MEVLIYMYTNNRKKEKKTQAIISDFGLTSLRNGLSLGDLTKRECKQFGQKMRHLLTSKTDLLLIVVLCERCATTLMKNNVTVKGLNIRPLKSFEIY